MGVLLGLGIFWTLYGIAGLFGFQVIPEKYQNREWTVRYIRYRGISWLMIGVPFLLLYLLLYGREMDTFIKCLLILLCGLPSIVYSFAMERNYRRKL